MYIFPKFYAFVLTFAKKTVIIKLSRLKRGGTMSKSICCFMNAKNDDASMKAVRFVYETECHTLNQPFVHPIYVLHIVTQGTAVLKIGENEHNLKRGTIFFAFPALPYYLEASEDFEYIYISFMGGGATSLLSRCNITPKNPVFQEFGFLCTIFESSIRRITPANSNLLTESILYYALSYFCHDEENRESEKNASTLFEAIVNYVDHHFRESDISLGRLADIFSYSEKYLSSLFKKNMHVGFITYLNSLRVQYASELISKGEMSIGEIAESCGYSDYSYFSKVFKKNTGKTPSESINYINERK